MAAIPSTTDVQIGSGNSELPLADAQSTKVDSRLEVPKRRKLITPDYADADQVGEGSFYSKEVFAHPHSNVPSQTESEDEFDYESEDESEVESDVISCVCDQEACMIALANMIIEDGLPFSLVEREGFRDFMGHLQPGFELPSTTTIARVCFERYVEEQLRMKQLLMSNCQRVSITTSTWTSIQKLNYICVSAHFIDNDWKLHKNIINFCPISSLKEDAIGEAVEKCLIEWGLMSKVFTITVDHAKSNHKGVNWIRRKMTLLGSNILGGEFLYHTCISRMINSMVAICLKNDVKSIFKIREALRYVKQSPSRLLKFKACAEKENINTNSGLCLDVYTKWSSTYLMLENACKFEKVFEAYAKVDPYFKIELDEVGLRNTRKKKSNEEVMYDATIENLADDEKEVDVGVANVEKFGGVPTEEDWNCARRLGSCLKFFYDLTSFVSSCHCVTANAYFDKMINVAYRLKEWQDATDYKLSILADSMKMHLDKYWGDVTNFNSLFFIAAILDPRRKFLYVQFCLDELHGHVIAEKMGKKVRDDINKLYQSYSEIYKPGNIGVAVEGGGSSERQESLNSESEQLTNARRNRFKKYKPDSAATSELQLYLEEPIIEMDSDNEFDMLDWWKYHSERFQILSKLARDVLALPISTVTSESAFNIGGRVLDTFRSSLTPGILQSLICTQDWIRTSKEAIDVEENTNDFDDLDFEFANLVFEPTISEM